MSSDAIIFAVGLFVTALTITAVLLIGSSESR